MPDRRKDLSRGKSTTLSHGASMAVDLCGVRRDAHGVDHGADSRQQSHGNKKKPLP